MTPSPPGARPIGIVGSLALVTVVLLASGVSGCTHPRTLVVVCRSMAFFVAGDATPNPTITVRAGETIALEVRNEDGPGVVHDFAVDPLRVGTELLLPGQVAHATFTAPDRPGQFEYYCRPHALVMRGTLVVEAR